MDRTDDKHRHISHLYGLFLQEDFALSETLI
ncbi:hypothetical protein [Chryseobacterium indoltheticum]